MKERNYGIDFLRLILMYMVCVLHVLGQGGVLFSCETGTIEHNTFWLLETFCYCAVNSFAIISGYTASEKPQKYDKLVNMWFQAFFYSFVLTMIFVIFKIQDWGSSWKSNIIAAAFPVTFQKFWYFTAFFALFFAIPLLKKFFFSLDKDAAQKAFFIIIVLYSIMGIISDPFKSNFGYSAIWLMVLYSFGLLAKRIDVFSRKSNLVLIIVWISCIIVSWAEKVFIGTGKLIDYISPTILLSGLIMVVLFSRIKFKGKIISKLSPLAFGIYLFQSNEVIWNKYIYNSFAFISTKNIFIGIILALVGALIIFVSGLIVEAIRSFIYKKLNISKLSCAIVKLFDNILSKLSILLN